jgi:tetratricopeptide (TPR) repeat protein
MRLFFLLALMLASAILPAQDDCFENKTHPLPVLSETAKRTYAAKLAIAEGDYRNDSSNADAIIWLGRRKAYLGQYSEAIGIYSRGLQHHPGDTRMYRHRGHRYITLRCFDKAIADLRKAADLFNGKPDEAEPDGLPNAKNTPTSTLQSNTWYHLGLAYFIKGDYKKALWAYRECLAVSKNPDMYVATANWLYIALRRLNKNNEAAKLLDTVSPGTELIENKDYLEILMLYKLKADPVEKIRSYAEKKELSLASYGYGLGVFLLNNDKKEEAKAIFQQILQSDQWSAFGYIAAEAELKRMK